MFSNSKKRVHSVHPLKYHSQIHLFSNLWTVNLRTFSHMLKYNYQPNQRCIANSNETHAKLFPRVARRSTLGHSSISNFKKMLDLLVNGAVFKVIFMMERKGKWPSLANVTNMFNSIALQGSAFSRHIYSMNYP